MAEETSQLSRLESLMAARLETCWSEAEECLEESLDVDQPEDEEDDSEECDIVKGIDEDGEDNDQQLPPSHTSSIVVVDFAALSRRPGAPDSASGGPSRRDKRAFLIDEWLHGSGENPIAHQPCMQSTAVSTTKASDGLFLSVKTKANARRRKDNEEDEAFDKAEDEQDRAVQELMESSKLIESLREAELKGRERIRYQQERLAALAGSANTVSVKAPLQVRLGMARKAALRTDKAIEEAKATGMFHSHAKKELLGRKKDLDAKRLTKQKQVQQKKGGRGIYGSIGTLKDGIMTLSEHQIESVRRGGSKKKKSTKAFKR